MTTWINVNLPWGPLELILPDPPFTEEMRAMCGGITFSEFDKKNDAQVELVYRGEGKGLFDPISEEGKAKVEQLYQIYNDLCEALAATPERIAHQDLCDQLRTAHEASYFRDQIKVGMFLEFQSGRRILVGDINAGAVEGGCCPQELPPDDIVVRYTMIQLPE